MDLRPLITHRFALEDIKEAYDLFSRQGDGVMKVALYPSPVAERRNKARDRTEALAHPAR